MVFSTISLSYQHLQRLLTSWLWHQYKHPQLAFGYLFVMTLKRKEMLSWLSSCKCPGSYKGWLIYVIRKQWGFSFWFSEALIPSFITGYHSFVHSFICTNSYLRRAQSSGTVLGTGKTGVNRTDGSSPRGVYSLLRWGCTIRDFICVYSPSLPTSSPGHTHNTSDCSMF